jgi:hypothetical protein
MTYEEIAELIKNVTTVYGITEQNNIIEGKIVSITQHREALSKDVSSNNPEITETNDMRVGIMMENYQPFYCNTFYLKPDEAKESITKSVEGQIKSLSSTLERIGVKSSLLADIKG